MGSYGGEGILDLNSSGIGVSPGSGGLGGFNSMLVVKQDAQRPAPATANQNTAYFVLETRRFFEVLLRTIPAVAPTPGSITTATSIFAPAIIWRGIQPADLSIRHAVLNDAIFNTGLMKFRRFNGTAWQDSIIQEIIGDAASRWLGATGIEGSEGVVDSATGLTFLDTIEVPATSDYHYYEPDLTPTEGSLTTAEFEDENVGNIFTSELTATLLPQFQGVHSGVDAAPAPTALHQWIFDRDARRIHYSIAGDEAGTWVWNSPDVISDHLLNGLFSNYFMWFNRSDPAHPGFANKKALLAHLERYPLPLETPARRFLYYDEEEDSIRIASGYFGLKRNAYTISTQNLSQTNILDLWDSYPSAEAAIAANSDPPLIGTMFYNTTTMSWWESSDGATFAPSVNGADSLQQLIDSSGFTQLQWIRGTDLAESGNYKNRWEIALEFLEGKITYDPDIAYIFYDESLGSLQEVTGFSDNNVHVGISLQHELYTADDYLGSTGASPSTELDTTFPAATTDDWIFYYPQREVYQKQADGDWDRITNINTVNALFAPNNARWIRNTLRNGAYSQTQDLRNAYNSGSADASSWSLTTRHVFYRGSDAQLHIVTAQPIPEHLEYGHHYEGVAIVPFTSDDDPNFVGTYAGPLQLDTAYPTPTADLWASSFGGSIFTVDADGDWTNDGSEAFDNLDADSGFQFDGNRLLGATTEDEIAGRFADATITFDADRLRVFTETGTGHVYKVVAQKDATARHLEFFGYFDSNENRPFIPSIAEMDTVVRDPLWLYRTDVANRGIQIYDGTIWNADVSDIDFDAALPSDVVWVNPDKSELGGAYNVADLLALFDANIYDITTPESLLFYALANSQLETVETYVASVRGDIKEITSYTATVPGADAYDEPYWNEFAIAGTGTPTADEIRNLLMFTIAEQAASFINAALVGNAITFTQEGGGTVSLALPSTLDGVVNGVTLTGTILTLTFTIGPDIVVDIGSILPTIPADQYTYVQPDNVVVNASGVTELTPNPAATEYAPGHVYAFINESLNTDAVTVNLSGLGDTELLRSDNTSFLAGELIIGRIVIFTITSSGTLVSNINPPTDPVTEAQVRMLLGLPSDIQSKILTGESGDLQISGNTLTFTNLDGTTISLTLPPGTIFTPPAGVVSTDSRVISLTPLAPITEYTAGMEIAFLTGTIVSAGSLQVNVSGVGLRSLLRSDSQEFAVGDLQPAVLVRAIYDGTNFVSNIDLPAITSLTASGADITFVRDNGSTGVISVTGLGSMTTEAQIRTLIGLTAGEQASFFRSVTRVGNVVTFTHEDGSTTEITLPAEVDDHVDSLVLNGNVLTVGLSDSPDLTIDLSGIIPVDDSIYIPPGSVAHNGNAITLTLPAGVDRDLPIGTELIFETEASNNNNVLINLAGDGFSRSLLKSDSTQIQNGELPNGRLIRIILRSNTQYISNINPSPVTRSAVYQIVKDIITGGDNITTNELDDTENVEIVGQPSAIHPTLAGSFQRAERIRFEASDIVLGLTKGPPLAAIADSPVSVVYGRNAATMLSVAGGGNRITVDQRGLYVFEWYGTITSQVDRPTPQIEVFRYNDNVNTGTPLGRTTSEYIRHDLPGQELTLHGFVHIPEDNTEIKIIPRNEHGENVVSFNFDTNNDLTLYRLSETDLPINYDYEVNRTYQSGTPGINQVKTEAAIGGVIHNVTVLRGTGANELPENYLRKLGALVRFAMETPDREKLWEGRVLYINDDGTLRVSFHNQVGVFVDGDTLNVKFGYGSGVENPNLLRGEDPATLADADDQILYVDVDSANRIREIRLRSREPNPYFAITPANLGVGILGYASASGVVTNLGGTVGSTKLNLLYEQQHSSPTSDSITTTSYVADNFKGVVALVANLPTTDLEEHDWAFVSGTNTPYVVDVNLNWVSHTTTPIPNEVFEGEQAQWINPLAGNGGNYANVAVLRALYNSGARLHNNANRYVYYNEATGLIEIVTGYTYAVSGYVYQIVVGLNNADLGDFTDNDHIYIQFDDSERIVALTLDSFISVTGGTVWSGTYIRNTRHFALNTARTIAIISDTGTSLEVTAALRNKWTKFLTTDATYPKEATYDHLNMPLRGISYIGGHLYPDDGLSALNRQNLYQIRKFVLGILRNSSNGNKPLDELNIRSGPRGHIDRHAGEAFGSDILRGTIVRPAAGKWEFEAEILLETGVSNGLSMAIYEIRSGVDEPLVVATESAGASRGSFYFSATSDIVHGKIASIPLEPDGITDYALVFGLNTGEPDQLLFDGEALTTWRAINFHWKFKLLEV